MRVLSAHLPSLWPLADFWHGQNTLTINALASGAILAHSHFGVFVQVRSLLRTLTTDFINPHTATKWSRSERPSEPQHHRRPLEASHANNEIADVTRRAAATSSQSDAPTVHDAHPRTRPSRDLPSETWLSLLRSVRLNPLSMSRNRPAEESVESNKWSLRPPR